MVVRLFTKRSLIMSLVSAVIGAVIFGVVAWLAKTGTILRRSELVPKNWTGCEGEKLLLK